MKPDMVYFYKCARLWWGQTCILTNPEMWSVRFGKRRERESPSLRRLVCLPLCAQSAFALAAKQNKDGGFNETDWASAERDMQELWILILRKWIHLKKNKKKTERYDCRLTAHNLWGQTAHTLSQTRTPQQRNWEQLFFLNLSGEHRTHPLYSCELLSSPSKLGTTSFPPL